MKFFKYFIICVAIFSCENTKKENQNSESKSKNTQIEINDDIFRVFLTVKSLEDDKFQILYVDNSPEGKYKPENRRQIIVTGKEELQTITFELPKGVIPYKFRLDLGEKGYETLLRIENIKVELNNNEMLIDSSTMNRYFQKNIYLETDDWLNFERKKVSGKYDPFITSKAFLIKKIEMEL